MRILIWDFDGVLVDTVRECYLITLEAVRKEKERIAMEAGIGKFAPMPFKDFRVFRQKSVNAADFFANYILQQKGMELTPENLDRVTASHLPFLKRMDGIFYEEREKLMEKDEGKYFESMRVYPGIPEALSKLSSLNVKHAIMSARDSYSIRQILARFRLREHFEFIIGHELNKGSRHVKALQIRRLKAHFSGKYPSQPIEYYFIDDIPFNLRKLQTQARLLFPEWGYGKLDEHYVNALRVKTPEELVELLGKNNHKK